MRILVEPVKHIRPGKAQVYLRPEANRLLEKAIDRHGAPIYPTGNGSAGRTYDQQAHYYDLYKNHGGPVASNPDSGPRPHMRFGAIDISDYSAREAMLAAGWRATTPSEWWHFEHPDCRSWPVVTSTYLQSVRELPDGDTMILIRRDGSATKEWSVFHPTFRGETELERGYIKFNDPVLATAFGRLLESGGGTEKGEQPEVYRSLQDAARVTFDAAQRGQVSAVVDLSVVMARLEELEKAVNRTRTVS